MLDEETRWANLYVKWVFLLKLKSSSGYCFEIDFSQPVDCIRGWLEEQACSFCTNVLETRDHFFCNCVYVKYLLLRTEGAEVLRHPLDDARELWTRTFNLAEAEKRKKGLSLLSAIWWVIWIERNNFIFQSRTPNPSDSLARVKLYLSNWSNFC